MKNQFISLSTLHSVTPTALPVLKKLDINTLADLLAFQPIRYAKYVQAAADNLLSKTEIAEYINSSMRNKAPKAMLNASLDNLTGIGREGAKAFNEIGIRTIGDLADFPAFKEAEDIVGREIPDDEDPNAPACVLPKCKKFTRNRKQYVSFFKQEEIREISINSNQQSMIANLFNFADHDKKILYLGYSVSYLQEWIYCGIHLGEPKGSVNLFMGQDSQVSVLDWQRSVSALRNEDSQAAERLSHTLSHQRAVDEVARATAEEHQYGGTSTFGANAATAGSFSAAGAVIGGVGGGISGALTGLAVDALLLGSDLGLGTISGAVGGSAIGSIAGSAAGSLVYSGATTLGFVETDANGERDIFARSAQNIQQNTVQNSSSLRSFWSNIISQSVEDEQQRISTNRVTNHNRIHALNALYFEILNEYKVNISADHYAPILFLPFKAIYFTEAILARYWWLIRSLLKDEALITALDDYFMTLNTNTNDADEISQLPAIEDIHASVITIELNLDGAKMKSIIGTAAAATFGLAGFVTALVAEFYRSFKHDNIGVSLLTSDGTINLIRVSSPNDDENFVGRYQTVGLVALHTIEKVIISNTNSELGIGISINDEFYGIKINELAFESASAELSISRRNEYRQALPTLGQLETGQSLFSRTMLIAGNEDKQINWNIADRLRTLFEGINEQRENLAQEEIQQLAIEAKLANLLGFLNANKYSFTRFILDRTEREQTLHVLEGVEIGGVPLSEIASTSPIGFCGNHVVLPLKKCLANHVGSIEPITIDTSKLELYLDTFAQANTLDVSQYHQAVVHFHAELEQWLLSSSSEVNSREDQLLKLIANIAHQLKRVMALTENSDTTPVNEHTELLARESSMNKVAPVARCQAKTRALQLGVARISNVINELIDKVSDILRDNVVSSPLATNKLCTYFHNTQAWLADKIGEQISATDISLPSPAVFMEPVLSHAKGAELYDMRRNSHWQVRNAPDIASADPNTLRAADINLQPNLPDSQLGIESAPQYALPTSLNSALTEAGKLDLTTLLNSNANTLTSTLSGLSTMATELAKASTELTGDAQQQVLGAASDVAKQISDIVQKAVATTPKAPPAPKPKPPVTPQEKVETVRRMEEIDKGKGTKEQKRERKEALGAPTTESSTNDYRMAIVFLDDLGVPYSLGEFTLSMLLPGIAGKVDINDGEPLGIEDGIGGLDDTFTLEKGRTATMQVHANIAGLDISGFKSFSLTEKSDVFFLCRMQVETRKVSATSVKEAVDQVVENSSFSAGINAMLSMFLNGEASFPFKIFELGVDAGADGGGKAELKDLRFDYQNGGSTTTTNTDGSTTKTDYEVVIPKNAWTIDIA